jgi:hypothetical protein
MIKSRWWKASLWLLLILLITYSYAFIEATTTDSSDQSECHNAVAVVTAKHQLPESLSQPGHPAIACELGVHLPLLQSYETVYVYGVTQPAEQDSIAAELRAAHRASHQHRMLVRFIDKENWRTWSDPSTGRSGGSRGPETTQRKLWIE